MDLKNLLIDLARAGWLVVLKSITDASAAGGEPIVWWVCDITPTPAAARAARYSKTFRYRSRDLEVAVRRAWAGEPSD